MKGLEVLSKNISLHEDVIDFKFRGPINPLEKHFYRDFTIAYPSMKSLELEREGEDKDRDKGGEEKYQDGGGRRMHMTRRSIGGYSKTMRQNKNGEDHSTSRTVQSPMSPTFRRIRALQMNENKFVFVVKNIDTDEKQVLKEITVSSEDKLEAVLKEYQLIRFLHQDCQGHAMGIIPTPKLYEEDLRCVMVYEMQPSDLFNFLNEYCNLKNTKGVPEHVAIHWIAQLLLALKTMVERGVCHRDLKPENILLDARGNILLTDFELAVTFPRNERLMKGGATQVVGTPLYIPPEVGTKRFVDLEKNDLWSVGVIGWELVHDGNPWGMNPDQMQPFETLERTNSTTKLSPDTKPKEMSDVYFDFIKQLVCQHDTRFSLKQAMSHELFRKGDIDFSNPLSVFPPDEVHLSLADAATFLDGRRKKMLGQDDIVMTPSAPKKLSNGTGPRRPQGGRRVLISKKREILEEIDRFHKWQQTQPAFSDYSAQGIIDGASNPVPK
eukprot:CAMPEP_0118647596 /NCGR_PEP_ID=MMETSP0785-20121206/8694_1 /TAXON_ID=91992 /ORGANISM="Bolidomonas pacifica, Strain CCMP 1866" /LENGTH=494 /DNA_ID=CAMNT_0006539707 /DNA_START=327 /DNA_END=1811 /DNA_ORIENTATION=+